jgi:hypothetical protein
LTYGHLIMAPAVSVAASPSLLSPFTVASELASEPAPSGSGLQARTSATSDVSDRPHPS